MSTVRAIVELHRIPGHVAEKVSQVVLRIWAVKDKVCVVRSAEISYPK